MTGGRARTPLEDRCSSSRRAQSAKPGVRPGRFTLIAHLESRSRRVVVAPVLQVVVVVVLCPARPGDGAPGPPSSSSGSI